MAARTILIGGRLSSASDETIVGASPISPTPTFTPGGSKVLFSASNYASFTGHHQYSVSPDGRRFLMVRQYGVAQMPRLVLVKNWVTQLQASNARK